MLSALPTSGLHRQRNGQPLRLGAREASPASRSILQQPEMLRAHLAGRSASVLTVGLLGWRRAQHDMVVFLLTMGLVNGFTNRSRVQHDT